uniref:Uncharacterized protein n=1 Tax=Anguilla anguilla TaxID=7936 RepID=A0A0E9SHW4_ANGAN
MSSSDFNSVLNILVSLLV